jgi:peptidoglycan-associated lipoprotein
MCSPYLNPTTRLKGECDMPRSRVITVMALVMLSVTTLDACQKKPVVVPVVAGPDTVAQRLLREQQIRDSIANAQRIRDSLLAEQRRRDSLAALGNRPAAGSNDAATLRSTLTAVVRFDYDQSDIRPDARAALDAKIPILQANPNVAIRIGGHTDERGSDEYNLALGQRRAGAAKRYLVERGIAESRIETVSFGEERPVAQGSDEGAYSQNRRAEFEITGGGQMLRRP